jgi:hypothetical protein
MACFTLRGPSGERKVAENETYRLMPGEAIVPGLIDWHCNGQDTDTTSVEAKLNNAGLQLGDAVAWVTKRLGVKQCAPCKARQEILNHASQVGWIETLRQIKETF